MVPEPGWSIRLGFVTLFVPTMQHVCINNMDAMFLLIVVYWCADKWLEQMIVQSSVLWRLCLT